MNKFLEINNFLSSCIKIYFFILIFSACANSNSFNGKQKSGAEATPPPNSSGDQKSKIDIGEGETITEEFNLEQAGGKLDLIWVIDNSGSMQNEIEQVERNFLNFATSLKQNLDLKLTLISAYESSGKSNFPIRPPNNLPVELEFMHIDHFVDSNDALEIAAFASCPSSSSAYNIRQEAKVCGKSYDPFSLAGTLTNFGDPMAVAGKLHSRFRDGAKKVFVFVTDDNANTTHDGNFLEFIQPYLNGSEAIVYGFVATSHPSTCSVSRTGSAYINLAEKTGGKIFDICQVDWTQHFSNLTSDVKHLVKNTFTLRRPPVRVISVLLNGLTLNPGDYSMQNNQLKIIKHLDNPSGKITIQYQ